MSVTLDNAIHRINHWPAKVLGKPIAGPTPPLFLDQTQAQRGEKIWGGDRPPPLSPGLDDRPPPRDMKVWIRHCYPPFEKLGPVAQNLWDTEAYLVRGVGWGEGHTISYTKQDDNKMDKTQSVITAIYLIIFSI